MNESPCINECVLDDDGFCIGCNRSVEEITSWKSMSDEEKHNVLDRIKEREMNESD